MAMNPESDGAGVSSPHITDLSDYQYLQKTLRSMSEDQAHQCCPPLFERAGSSWWNPRFDSDILEGQYWRSTFPRTTRRFQLGLSFLLILCLIWAVYFPLVGSPHWYIFLTCSVAMGGVLFVMIVITTSSIYSRNCFKVSLLFSILVTSLSLSIYLQLSPEPFLEKDESLSENSIANATGTGYVTSDFSEAGLFALYVQILLLIYTVIPLPLYGTLIVGLLYTCLLEIFAGIIFGSRIVYTIVRLLLHTCLHILGCHILLMTNVRMRDTFMKVGQSLLVKRQLVMEKQLKEKMIHSVMPPKVSDWLITGGVDDEDDFDIDSETGSMMRKVSSPRSSNQGDIRKNLFRPFNMNATENVSILFADIVGFTKMSSNKSASQLVGLLNDLFGRFDRMCSQCNCEKISTLGDCYYCVSGCPEPREDHANNCVKMGLSMIRAIKEFDKECNEDVNMRVGIHTGTVLCGIVGRKRFKFDVWSNDVTLANRMESTGKPGKVHISEKTYQFLKEDYFVEEADDFLGMKTYFITGRKDSSSLMTKSESATDNLVVTSLNNINNNIMESEAKSLPSLETSLDTPRDGETKEEGKVMINKLHRFLRQRSVPANSNLSGVDDDKEADSNVEDDKNNSVSEDISNAEQMDRINNLDCKPRPSPVITSSNANGVAQGMCPLVSMDSEFDIISGIATPASITKGFSTPLSMSQHNLETSLSQPAVTKLDESSCYNSKTKTSINSNALKFHDVDVANNGSGPRITDSLRFHQLRKQSDLVLIRSVQEDTAHQKYFTKPPLHFLSCFFLDYTIESEYRRTAWRANQNGHGHSEFDPEPTLASSSYNAYIDILLSGIIYLLVSVACLVTFGASLGWVIICTLAGVCYVLVISVSVNNVLVPGPPRSIFRKLYNWCLKWYPTQVFGALLIALPIISVYSNMNMDNLGLDQETKRNCFMNLLVVTLIHFCNFTQIYCYVKSLLATLFALVFVVFMFIPGNYPCPQLVSHSNSTSMLSDLDVDACLDQNNSYKRFLSELVLVFVTLIVLIWMLNREFEINYRLSYHCSLLAARDRKKILFLKNQADWLLHNIIPSHVSDQLKKSAKYSENHKDIGIVFASLVNFNELYDESYMGGKEFLRVLNELISDFDDLLDKAEFKNVEKIKTIGATFMAASGLNPFIRNENTHKHQHLHELMEFAYSLQASVEDFNQSLIEFDLILRIGFNYGDITSGVIGTTKLYYDIWGDAVNIASRMDSCGVDGRVQVNERTKNVMSQWYDFEERGEVFIKGKDNMRVFLLKGRKE